MSARLIMVQGTASHVGKSILVAALCRIFRQDGYSVAPFKAQNMSLNSFVTPDGAEIGRAQAVQAEAAGIPPQAEMNPVLLKPEADDRCQVVRLGRRWRTLPARGYEQVKPELWSTVTASLETLRSKYEIVVMEGAGSPAEINLMHNDIVNMSVARYSRAPVILVGDIDRGGVFASLLGTLWLLPDQDRDLVKGLVINKFRGDPSLLESGLEYLKMRSGIPVLGVVPYLHQIGIAEEDSVALEQGKVQKDAPIEVTVARLPHISNFDDFDPLARNESVSLRYIDNASSLLTPDLIILPGSKSTMADLAWLKQTGLASRIKELHRQGAYVIGICGGYQMLGETIFDPDHVESAVAQADGLGLLPVATTFQSDKSTFQVKGEVVPGEGMLARAKGTPFQGYEIHMGETTAPAGREAFRIMQRSGQACNALDGCLDETGRVLGTYIHGLFQNENIARCILAAVASAKGVKLTSGTPPPDRESAYNRLADTVRHALDIKRIYDIMGFT